GTALKNQEKVIRKLLPPGYKLQVGGMAEKMGETFSEFKLVSLIAVILTYLLLAAIIAVIILDRHDRHFMANIVDPDEEL
ncbi:MAG TPA: hypothetical protein PLX72_05775, partial [Candidatus Syntrophosphaera sp.]|nr:hypothetical protein [Candidatus Syntrophosphaera sp.]